MDTACKTCKVGPFMKDSGKMVFNRDKANTFPPNPTAFTTDNGSMASSAAKANVFGPMVTNITANVKTECSTGGVHINGKRDKNMLGIGRMGNNMGVELM